MFHLDTLATLVAATLTLLLGRKLVHSVSFLKKYTIPEPVAGGLLVALALLVLKKSMGWEVNFDMSLRDPLMLAFFATIGLNANIASLRAGGRVVGIFLIVVVGLLVMQNAIGIGMASLLGLDPLMGLLAGSITLSGGHGTDVYKRQPARASRSRRPGAVTPGPAGPPPRPNCPPLGPEICGGSVGCNIPLPPPAAA